MNSLIFEKFNSFLCWVVPVQAKQKEDLELTETSSDDTSDEGDFNSMKLQNFKKCRFVSFFEMLV